MPCLSALYAVTVYTVSKDRCVDFLKRLMNKCVQTMVSIHIKYLRIIFELFIAVEIISDSAAVISCQRTRQWDTMVAFVKFMHQHSLMNVADPPALLPAGASRTANAASLL